MTTSHKRQLTPLLVFRAHPVDHVKWSVDAADLTQDPLPAAVERHPDGRVANRQTYMTDVRHETTDDN